MNVEPELIEGAGGVFEIELDGDLIFSKRQMRRFPDEGEVERALRERLSLSA